MPAKTLQETYDEIDSESGNIADSKINYQDAIDYWSSVPASVNGVLGGFGEQTPVPKADIVGSTSFLRKLQTRMSCPEGTEKLTIDMGAGIGRITRDLLWKVSDKVDLLEPVKPFVQQMHQELIQVSKRGKLGDIYDIGMQEWYPPADKKYWLVWCQWCVGQLPDDELVQFWSRCRESLLEGGLGTMIVKENIAPYDDIFDDTDSSVTRTDEKFRQLFIQAGFKLIASDVQKGMPKELFPVRMYCLKPL
ncbi:alpha-N-methyltransferase NTM1 [Scheffersomyces coipomensis]|uniref:alpha-N-methyltransferase NTM1 n=1 Tax=Scheffersomyces coipomensis TaxID=1788519 RepID=UPI00315CE2B2